MPQRFNENVHVYQSAKTYRNASCALSLVSKLLLVRTTRFWNNLHQVRSKSKNRKVIYNKGPGGSMSLVVGLPNNSYMSITNTAWVRARLCILQKSALDSQSQVIKCTKYLPIVGGSLWVLRILPPLKLVAMI